jgi:putative membrane protein
MDPSLVALAVAASVIGSAAGLFTGLVPGVHVNTLASVMLIAYPSLAAGISGFTEPDWAPLLVAVLIVSASVVHSFVDFVPSVFTGAPDPDEALTVLPGHRLLMEGRGMVAVRAAAVGSLVGAVSALMLAVPLQYLMIAGLSERLDLLTFSVLSFTVAVMVIQAQGRRLTAVALLLLSGSLGFISMHGGIPCTGLLGEGTLLFPILSGLFGMPALLTAAGGGTVPPQEDDGGDPVGAWPGIRGVVMGCVAGWYPGITSAAGASLASAFSPGCGPERFISMSASIGTVTAVFSVVTLSVTGSGRSGAVLVVKEIIGGSAEGFCSDAFLLMLAGIAVAAVIGYAATVTSGRAFSRMSAGRDLSRANRAVVAAVALLVLLLTGPCGLLFLAVATVIGFIPLAAGCGRIPLAGCLILPVLVSELSLTDAILAAIV